MSDPRFNPFPGLRPFNPHFPPDNENHLFFGREGQSAEVLARLRENRFLAVVGTSGSGKSSLIRAGLLPDLIGGFLTPGVDWRMAIFRPIGDPMGNLARALNKPDVLQTEEPAEEEQAQSDMLLEVTLRRSGLGLVEATRLARLPEKQNLLVVVDQFEELFRFADAATTVSQADDATAFVKLLLEATRQTEIPIYVVITMRSDFIGDCARYPDLPEAVTEGMYLIPRMTREQRKSAIQGPVAVGGGTIAPRLLNRLLNEAGDNPDHLPVLQHALMRTWDHWVERTRGQKSYSDTPIDIVDYEEVGGLDNALSNHADEAYKALKSDEHREIARRMFQGLTERGPDNREVRRPTSVGKIATVAHAPLEDVIEVVDQFRMQGRSFLNTPESGALGADSLIDISHESLIRQWRQLRIWVNEEAESARTYRRLADAAERHDRGEADVRRGLELQNYVAWRERDRPTAEWAERYAPNFERVMAYLDESIGVREAEEAAKERERREREEEKERRRREQLRQARKNLAIVSVLAVLALVAGAYGWYQAGVARDREKTAVQERQKADFERARAEKSEKLAHEKEDEANKSAELAQKEEEVAKEKEQLALADEKAARESEQKARFGGLRERKLEWESVGTELYLLDQLIEVSTPRKAVQYRLWKAQQLIHQDKKDEALEETKKALQVAPDSEDAHTEKGYIHILRNEPDKALEEFQYIRDRINPKLSLNSLNLAMALVELGKYAEANQALEQAIRETRIGASGAGEGQLPDEITEATGRTMLSPNSESLLAALYYLKAEFAAYAGSKEFLARLNEADAQVETLKQWPGDQQDAWLLGVTWAWLHERGRPEDYGAYAIEGALWEKAGYRRYAARSYARFRELEEKKHDPRYAALAAWVKGRVAKIDPNGFYARAKQVANPGEVEVEAEILRAKKKLADAEKLLNSLIEREPGNTRLYLKRIGIYFDMTSDLRKAERKIRDQVAQTASEIKTVEGQLKDTEKPLGTGTRPEGGGKPQEQAEESAAKAQLREKLQQLESQRKQREAEANGLAEEAKQLYEKVIQDSNLVLARKPGAAAAYIDRAYANYYARGTPAPPLAANDPVLEDLRRGLEFKQDFYAMESQSFLLTGTDVSEMKEDDPRFEESVRLHELYKGVAPWDAPELAKLAELQYKKKRYTDALESVEAAIAADLSVTSFYDTRAKIETALGRDQLLVQRRRARGYRRAADALRLTEKNAEADEASKKSWGPMAEIAKTENNAEILCDPEMKVCTENRVVQVSGDYILSLVESVTAGKGNNRTVRIDRGSEDGIILLTQGKVYAMASEEAGHERRFKQIGTGEVTAVEQHSALVRVTMDAPTGDGMVRARDGYYLPARMPNDEKRSILWDLARFHITLLDRGGNKTLLEYRGLFGRETPELETNLYATMLDDVHGAATSGNKRAKEPMVGNRFAGGTLGQALEQTTRADLETFFKHVFDNRGDYFGQEWKLINIYETWLLYGNRSAQVHCGIESVSAGEGAIREARIGRGSEDGVVSGARGTVYSLYSEVEKHERKVTKIGTGEVLSVEPKSAVVRITMNSPTGDGLVRPKDSLLIKVRVPEGQPQTSLWELAEFNITLQDIKRKPIVDYRMLYGKETAELDSQIYKQLLDDIRAAGKMDVEFLKKKLEKGKFAGKTAGQALQETTRDDLERFFKYVFKYPATYFGHESRIVEIYAVWVLTGTPDE